MSDKNTDKINILEAIAREWNNAGIEYAVIHGLENYPDKIGRDLDILILKKHLDNALRIAYSVLQDNHWTAFLPPPVWGHRVLATQDCSWDSLIEIHFIQRLSWRTTILARSPTVTGKKGPFKIDPWASFAKRILLPLLSSKTDRLMKRPQELNISIEEYSQIKDQLPTICGNKITEHLLDSLAEIDVSKIQEVTRKLRRSCTLRSLFREPLPSIIVGIQAVQKKFVQFFSPCTPVVALVGLDGAGKSTTIDYVSSSLANLVGTVINHWRPSFLPRLGWFLGKPAIDLQPNGLSLPRREAGRFSLLRVGYYFIDYVLGYYIKDRLHSSRQRLVLYDRCALDMAVDPVRFGLSSPRGTRLLWRLIPKPDLVILLYDEPERIHARKPELPVEEIARQNALWLQLVAEGEVSAVIQVDAGPDEVAERVKGLILEKFIERNMWASSKKQADIHWIHGILQGARTAK